MADEDNTGESAQQQRRRPQSPEDNEEDDYDDEFEILDDGEVMPHAGRHPRDLNGGEDVVARQDRHQTKEERQEQQERRHQNKGRTKNRFSRATSATSSSTTWQSTVTNVVRRGLPPPILKLIDNTIDPVLEPYVGPDSTITVATSLLVATFVLFIVRRVVARLLGKEGKAIADDDDDHTNDVLRNQEHYDATVLLCGPIDGGKTRIFYDLCHDERDVPTLLSIRANIGVVEAVHSSLSSNTRFAEASSSSAGVSEGGDDQKSDRQNIRYVDWPGHASLSDSALDTVFDAADDGRNVVNPLRIVVVLDSTQPAAPAADVLDQLFTILYDRVLGNSVGSDRKRSTKKNSNEDKKIPVFVACNKQDLPKSKNAKRVKIQVRTELERILKSRAAASESDGGNASSSSWWPNVGEPLDLDDLSFCQLQFGQISCAKRDHSTWQRFVEFCQTGSLPTPE